LFFGEWRGRCGRWGGSHVVARPRGGTDHVLMQSVGIPAFQFVQDPLDYNSRVHHTSVDTYDHMKMADLQQATIVMASFLWQAGWPGEPLPRMPLATKPVETNPFAYEDDDD